jgi:hypothetical protein
MKKNYLILGAALALSGVSAYAQATYTVGDLIVGFEQNGNANSVEIDLGNISTFTTGGVASNHNYGDISSALTGFGGVASNLQWSVTGTIGLGNVGSSTTLAGVSLMPNALWVTQSQLTGAGVQGSTLTSITFGSSAGPLSNINTMGIDLTGKPSIGATGILLNSSVLPVSDTASYGPLMGSFPNMSFASEGSIERSGAGSLDLYLLNSTVAGTAGKGGKTQGDLGVTFLGTFDLSSAGQLTFTAGGTPIPEPSTYAMILGVAALGFVMLRRRQQMAA